MSINYVQYQYFTWSFLRRSSKFSSSSENYKSLSLKLIGWNLKNLRGEECGVGCFAFEGLIDGKDLIEEAVEQNCTANELGRFCLSAEDIRKFWFRSAGMRSFRHLASEKVMLIYVLGLVHGEVLLGQGLCERKLVVWQGVGLSQGLLLF